MINQIMSHKDLQIAAFKYFRIKRIGEGFNVGALEVNTDGNRVADVMVASTTPDNKIKYVIEIECKAGDRNDLTRDLRKKKDKLAFYDAGQPTLQKPIPNFFYYCVPKWAEKDAIEVLSDPKNSLKKFGIIAVSRGEEGDYIVEINKRASELVKEPSKRLYTKILNRMSTQLLNYVLEEDNTYTYM